MLAADFVELDSGTGLVHEAPAFGEVDYDLHRNTIAEYTNADEIPLLCPIGPDGKFDATVEDMQGKFVKDADRELIHKLRESGVLVLRENYRHEYPFCWRADDDPLIQFARPAWFIKTTARNKEVLANNAKIHWLPEHIGTGRFGDFLRNNVDWALSRERYWGTPLNIWINDETGNMQAPASVDEILAKNPSAFDHWHAAKKENPDLNDHLIVHKPWIDDVTWTEPGEPGVYRRVSEVIDCWFDSGCMPFAQWGFPHKNQEKFKASFPADYITEAIDQTRGWFYSQLMISTLVFDEECQKRVGLDPVRPYPHPFRTCIVLGHVTDPEGKKESKSKGNYTPPDAVMEKVAQEFAVVEAEQCGVTIKPGQAVIAREDLEALDLKPGDVMTTRCAANPDKPLELAMQPGKKMPRRVIVLAPEDREKTGAQVNSKGVAIKPNEVMWLPPSERILVESSISAAPGADAFRWLFLAGTPPWSQKRHSLGLVRTIQKEFPLKLRNVYAFFTIYANIDGYDPAVQKGRPVSDRTVLDRWILSELALTTQAVRENMDAFRAYEAAQALNNFVDGLSNWYVRRSRARYWKSEMDADKTDAYATLYESLVVIAKLAGPFTPFLAEEIYQNLVRRPFPDAPESVHLCDRPRRTRRPSTARSRRNGRRPQHRLARPARTHRAQAQGAPAVAQGGSRAQRRRPATAPDAVPRLDLRGAQRPRDRARRPTRRTCSTSAAELPPPWAPPASEDEVRQAGLQPNRRGSPCAPSCSKRRRLHRDRREAVALDPEDVEVLVEAEGGYAAAGDTTTVVALDTEIDQQLLDEGLYREILRRVQDLRRTSTSNTPSASRSASAVPTAWRTCSPRTVTTSPQRL
ncbi:MAG: class I tRNA ligase family protein [Bryobacterales bacterium]